MSIHRITALRKDDLEIGTDPEAMVEIAHSFPASEDVVSKVLEMPVHDDGRSDFEWIRLANGDLILGVWPRGEGYFSVEIEVEADYKAALDTDNERV